jgi:glucose dehydrogenase
MMGLFRRTGAAMGAAVTAMARAVPALLRDVVGLSGLAAIGYGTWLIYVPAAFIFAGLAMLVISILLARRSAA